ncbi:RNA polymerase sigma factor [Paenibacillus marinisediminis]
MAKQQLNEHLSASRRAGFVWEEVRIDLIQYCASLTHTRWDAEDLAQDTILRLLPMQQEWEQHPAPQAFMFRIAKNRWLDQKRREETARHKVMELQQTVTVSIEQGVELDEALRLLITCLSPLQRTVFLLREGFNFSNADVARLLQTTEGAVKSVLNRARKAVSGAVEQHSHSEQLSEDDKHALLQYAQALRIGDAAAVVRLLQTDSIDQVQAISQLHVLAAQTPARRASKGASQLLLKCHYAAA